MWFADKAFGFIIPDGGGDDVMVHKNEVADGMELGQGMPVKYEAGWDPIKSKFKATRCMVAFGAGCGAAAGRGPQGPHPPSDNLFIAGLPFGFSEDMVWQLFGQYGPVTSVRVLPTTGKPDTAVMVRFADSHMAVWMVENLNGNIPVGLTSPITVKFAQSAGQGKAGGKGFTSDTGKSRYSPYATPTGASASGSGSTLGSTPAAYSGAGGLDSPQYQHQALHAHPGSQGLGMAAEVDATWTLDQGMSDMQSAPSACSGTPQSHAVPLQLAMHSDSAIPPPPPPPPPAPPPALMSQQLLDESGYLVA
jgi:cold shock CspA family protein